MRIPRVLFLMFALAGTSPSLVAAEQRKDLEFAQINGQSLHLDLYYPDNPARPKTIVWVHGGAWRRGSRESVPILDFLKAGYAIASVDYRLTPIAPFPAQIHDIKAAIRYLRANSNSLNLDTERLAIAGASAGGHLVALVGTTNGHPELEGTVGDHLDQSSDVHAIVSYYGASNLTTILTQSTPHGLSVRVPALELLLGGQPDERTKAAQLASPVFHVDRKDPPLVLIHGDQDPQMPINQSHELHGKYRSLNLPVFFEVVHGAAHGGREFYDAHRNDIVLKLLKKTL